MTLRGKILTLSLATLLLPWSGWKLLQEMEQFLRQDQEAALTAAARMVATTLPSEFQTELMFSRNRSLTLRSLDEHPRVDGYASEWSDTSHQTEFVSADGRLRLRLMAAEYQQRLYLFCRVTDDTPVRDAPLPSPSGLDGEDGLNQDSVFSDHLVVYLRDARGLVSYRISTAAPGPLNLSSQSAGGGQLEGYWLDNSNGYTVELAMAITPGIADISIGVLDAESSYQSHARETGTTQGGVPQRWLNLIGTSPSLTQWLQNVTPDATRSWLVDRSGWIVADSGVVQRQTAERATWLQRLLYHLVAGFDAEPREAIPEGLTRIPQQVVASALQGESTQQWDQEADTAALLNLVAVPVRLIADDTAQSHNGDIRGAIVMEASSDGLLLVTNRALGRLIFITLVLSLGLALGLWLFASRLSRRVTRLSSAVSDAMANPVTASAEGPTVPLVEDQDELGELARNNQHLLEAVTEYTRYLQTLASKLSHELKTPLAITRSSLDNLSDSALDEDSRRYLQRAQEGLDRQTGIVRAMSEASRLEAAIQSVEWMSFDVVDFLRNSLEGYRSLFPQRQIELQVQHDHLPMRGAPDLLSQALDKLVDNAVSFSSYQDRIELSLTESAAQLAISVSNTGSSLPTGRPEQLFDSLYSLRPDRGSTSHLGLGLYVVKLVAEAHGGKATAKNIVDNKQPVGVSFTMYLDKQ